MHQFMKFKRLTAIFAAIVVIASGAFAQQLPTLRMSEAAKLAEDAITAASLPAECYLRSISLVEKPSEPPYYRATYKPAVTRRVRVDSEPEPIIVEFMCITIEGKVSFERDEMNPPRRIRTRTQ
jgi:hypothetical protein